MKRLLTVLASSVATVLTAIAIVIACGSSPLPPTCPQSIFLGKFSSAVILIPPGGGPFPAPIGLFPFVSWDNITPGCAQPASARATLTLNCVDITGTAYTVGPQVFALPNPATPGAQPPAGTTVSVTVPGGVLPSVCTVVGTYDVNFAGGIGAGVLQATGDLQICLVEPSPEAPTEPRLDMQMLSPDELAGEGLPGAFRFHQGDQAYFFIRVANNDLENSATLDMEAIGRQVAGFPDGVGDDATAFNAGVFRISDIAGDVFPATPFDDSGPPPVAPVPGTPQDPNPRPLFDLDLTLGPGEVDIFGLAVRNHGACPNGACGESSLCGEVDFGNGDEGFACTQLVSVVDNTLAPRYPGHTSLDEIKVHPQVDAQWGPLEFINQSGNRIDGTHRGNLLPELIIPELSEPAIQTTGEVLRETFNVPFHPTWVDQVTLPVDPYGVRFDAAFFDQRDNFVGQLNRWNVVGLPGQTAPCPLPALSFQPGQTSPFGGFTDLLINFQSDGACGGGSLMQVFQQTPQGPLEIFIGTFDQLILLAEQDPFFKLDFASCRTISWPIGNNLNRLFMVADPPFLVDNANMTDPFIREVNITDPQGNPINWTVRYEGTSGVTPATTAGIGLSDVVIDPSGLTDPLGEIAGFLIYENPNAINSPLPVPVIARRQPTDLLPMVVFEPDGPPVIQAGDTYTLQIDIPVQPLPGTLEDVEILVQFDSPDDLIFTVPPPFVFTPIDGSTPQNEIDDLEIFFGDGFESSGCTSGAWKCGKVELGTVSPPLLDDMEIFADGFESGDVSAWSTGVRGSNTQAALGKTAVFFERQSFVVLPAAGGQVPVDTEEELRELLELLEAAIAQDPTLPDVNIGLNNNPFEIDIPLPPIRGTYFFDEFESFRKSSTPVIVLDGSGCPAPCSGLVFEAGGGVRNLVIQNFPDYGVEARSDSVVVAASVFDDNGAGGLLIDGNGATIGGSSDDANRFEDSGGTGVTVVSGTGNLITYNTFASNAGQAIDLGDDGVTGNDTGDGDGGPNGLQNFPVLTDALLDGTGTRVEGSLNSTAGAAFTLQFFSSGACDASGNGEGNVFLGETTVTTAADGTAPFALTLGEGTARNEFVTATATGADGTSEFSACFEVVAGVAVEDDALVPTTYALFQNYPNPFNPETTIRFDVPRAGPVTLVVFDLIGRAVATLVDGERAAGQHLAVFSARDLPSGTYLYTLRGEGFSQTRKLVLLK